MNQIWSLDNVRLKTCKLIWLLGKNLWIISQAK